jgi:hemoglobin
LAGGCADPVCPPAAIRPGCRGTPLERQRTVAMNTFVDDSLLAELDEQGRRETPTSALMAIGGARAVAAVVDEFYRRLLSDPATAPYFTSLANMDGLKRHQVLMLVKVLGGPDRYDGQDLRSAHAHLGIDAEAYSRVCLHLLTVMHDFKVPMDVLVAANQILASVQSQIVTRNGGGGQ